ncbi:hypothetical protein DPMN_017490 [Dreissena polymorpha]|uniref:Uncharacterized protein n=1 Tax=Dreissena polymorpha TaxID=45954 RepID=A0A9D4NBG8_DREPO|nr:hypothetical protein DPMN_017490 [Dreissena polymorpha]
MVESFVSDWPVKANKGQHFTYMRYAQFSQNAPDIYFLPVSQCSASCGEGSQSRRAVCQAVTKEGWILPGEVPYGCKISDRPPESQICNHGPCQARYKWVVAPWGEVRILITLQKNAAII